MILDSSKSVGWNNYETLKRSFAKLTDYFDVSEEGAHFGFIHYNQEAFLDFDFADKSLHDSEALKAKILEIQYDQGLTRTDKAIKMANERLFSAAGGTRKDVPKFLVVLTDGNTMTGSQPYANVLAPLKVNLLLQLFPVDLWGSICPVFHKFIPYTSHVWSCTCVDFKPL